MVQRKHKRIIYPEEIFILKSEQKNIPFDVAKKYFKSDFNTKLKVEYICSRCGKFDITQFRNLKSREIDLPYCNNCWLRIRTCENQEWLNKNSEIQKIVQNKPEVKSKNSASVKKFWENNPEKLKQMREKILENKNINNPKFFRGYFKGIYFESGYELFYLIYCFKNNIKVRRYEKKDGYIEYYNPIKEKNCLYKPDFIINDETIIEIKGSRFLKIESLKLILEAKISALKYQNKVYKILYKNDIKNISRCNRLRRGSKCYDNIILKFIKKGDLEIISIKQKEYYNELYHRKSN
jgi:hypothetical protein